MKQRTFYVLTIAIVLFTFLATSCSDDEDNMPDNVIPETVTLDCAAMTEPVVLKKTAASPDYYIPCRIEVGALLTIEPGVEIAFGESGGLEFNNSGILDARGSAAEPIIFRGEQEGAGFWRGLFFDNSANSNKMHFVSVQGGGSLPWDGSNIKANILMKKESYLELVSSTIRQSGSDGLYTEGTPSALSGFGSNTFSDNMGFPLRVQAHQVGSLGRNTYQNNGTNAIEVYAASRNTHGIIGEHSWPDPGAPLWINARLDIGYASESGALTVGEGTVIEMGSDASIAVNEMGTLSLNGSASQAIIINSQEDKKDFWRGIHVASGSPSNVFNYAQISGAGSASHNGYPGRDVVRLGSNTRGPYRLTMNNCILSNSSHCGLRYSSNENIANFSGDSNQFVDLGEDQCDF